MLPLVEPSIRVQRVRAILLTGRGTILFIKRIKPNNSAPYWVAPGGGVEFQDIDLQTALTRELQEELGATVQVLELAFVLEHRKANKDLEEHFYLCHLCGYDLSLRDGPEFDDPTRGEYIPDEVPLTRAALQTIAIKTPELSEWLLNHLTVLQQMDWHLAVA